MFNKQVDSLLILLLLPVLTFAQNCNLTISGTVEDANSGIPISYANVYLKEVKKGVVSDEVGFFQFQSICTGNYHLAVSHIGCATKEIYLNVRRDISLNIVLDHNNQLLDEVTVTGEVGKITTQETGSFNEASISENTDKNLASMLENISGVSTIRNGKNIAKPVVHGLYGNRLTILNNGIVQSGQQWGADHAPEIDPLIANRITVIKGVSTLEYPGNTLGSVVLIETRKIDKEPHLHGKVRGFFQSNGLGSGWNLQLQQYHEKLAWRVMGTMKKSADSRAPNYYLTNTSVEEANIAVQLEKSLTEDWISHLYFSSFNSNLGVLRGSHIGNLTDLQEALTRKVPFFTKDKFSYKIEAPSQKVNHHLLKLHSKYFIGKNQWVNFTYAGQLDLRKEFDVRRSGRTDLPALSLKQFAHFLEGKYERHFSNYWELKTGAQFNRVDNTNIPETGILPLIPDYIANESGVFALVNRQVDKVSLEFGGRYDYESQSVATISFHTPRKIVRYENKFQNFSALGGISYEVSKPIVLTYNMGFTSRNPEVNELYSNGLHQGVSGIEEGDPSLAKEKAFKNTLSAKVKGGKLFIESLFYFQNIYDYIFLNPQDEMRLTIRGAFPVFKYEQTDVHILGLDLASTYQFSKKINAVLKYSFIRGRDWRRDLPLINLPSNNLFVELNYQVPKIGTFENIKLQVNNKYVFKQTQTLLSQDFTPPPEGYDLIGLKISTDRLLGKMRLSLYVRVDNLLNVTYRDYLNRQRYFADDLGIDIAMGIGLTF